MLPSWNLVQLRSTEPSSSKVVCKLYKLYCIAVCNWVLSKIKFPSNWQSCRWIVSISYLPRRFSLSLSLFNEQCSFCFEEFQFREFVDWNGTRSYDCIGTSVTKRFPCWHFGALQMKYFSYVDCSSSRISKLEMSLPGKLPVAGRSSDSELF